MARCGGFSMRGVTGENFPVYSTLHCTKSSSNKERSMKIFHLYTALPDFPMRMCHRDFCVNAVIYGSGDSVFDELRIRGAVSSQSFRFHKKIKFLKFRVEKIMLTSATTRMKGFRCHPPKVSKLRFSGKRD